MERPPYHQVAAAFRRFPGHSGSTHHLIPVLLQQGRKAGMVAEGVSDGIECW